MRLGTGDLTLLDDLHTHFERSGFVVEKQAALTSMCGGPMLRAPTRRRGR